MSTALQMVLKYIFRPAKTPCISNQNEFIDNTIIVFSVAIKGKKYSVVNLMICVV